MLMNVLHGVARILAAVRRALPLAHPSVTGPK